jgi:nucleoside-diphosphate-sugar epimerase
MFANSLHHKRSFTFVGDIVTALVKALDTEACIGEIINLGTPKSISTAQAIQIVEDLTGQKANYVEKPPRPGDQQETAAVIGKAERILGYHPGTPFAEGIRSEIAWFKALPDDLRACYSPSV